MIENIVTVYSGTLVQSIVKCIKQLGSCNIFDIQSSIADVKLSSIQRALDSAKHKGYIDATHRNESIKIPIGGDLRILTYYQINQNIEGIDIMSCSESKKYRDITQMEPQVRQKNAIQAYTLRAINARCPLELVWPNIVSITYDDD